MNVPMRIASALSSDITRLIVILFLWAASCVLIGGVARVAWTLGTVGWNFISRWL